MRGRGAMIWESILYATAQTSPELRRLGLVGDALALRSRANRQARAWRPHELRCHAFVEQAAGRCARRRTALVLGSGLLRDVPAARLAGMFERLVFVDAVHLLPARLRARRLGAETVVADLSGGDRAGVAKLKAEAGIDLVVSANLLSQMPLPHRRTSGDWEDPEPLVRIGGSHLADLRDFGAPICLISDLGYRDVGPRGPASEECPLVDESLLPPPQESWDWEVAPRGEIDRAFARIHRVGAWHFGAGDIEARTR